MPVLTWWPSSMINPCLLLSPAGGGSLPVLRFRLRSQRREPRGVVPHRIRPAEEEVAATTGTASTSSSTGAAADAGAACKSSSSARGMLGRGIWKMTRRGHSVRRLSLLPAAAAARSHLCRHPQFTVSFLLSGGLHPPLCCRPCCRGVRRCGAGGGAARRIAHHHHRLACSTTNMRCSSACLALRTQTRNGATPRDVGEPREDSSEAERAKYQLLRQARRNAHNRAQHCCCRCCR
jgi:hypothetical protein